MPTCLWADLRCNSTHEKHKQEVRSIRNLYALALNLTMTQHVAISAAGANYSYTRATKEWVQLVPALFSGNTETDTDTGTGAHRDRGRERQRQSPGMNQNPRDLRMVIAYLSSDLLTGVPLNPQLPPFSRTSLLILKSQI